MKRQMGTLKKLTLNRETLRDLQAGEMQNVNGGATVQPACNTQSVCATLCTVCVSCRGGSTCL